MTAIQMSVAERAALGHTGWTGQPGDRPAGPRTSNLPNASADTRRGPARETEAAEILAARGFRVEQNPTATTDGTRPTLTPDDLAEGGSAGQPGRTC